MVPLVYHSKMMEAYSVVNSVKRSDVTGNLFEWLLGENNAGESYRISQFLVLLLLSLLYQGEDSIRKKNYAMIGLDLKLRIVYVQRSLIPSKHDTLVYCWSSVHDVGPTVNQRLPTPRVCWDSSFIIRPLWSNDPETLDHPVDICKS